jgi:molybdopterin-containing oxidoreductase family membrane subunit
MSAEISKTPAAANVHVARTRRQVEADVLVTLGPFTPRQKLLCAALGAICALGLVAYVQQLRHGLSVTGMGNYFSWGIYIINFVFFIGISHAGTLVSAILRVTGAGWRRPITRMAEAITLFALLIGGPMVIIDMGRPDRIWHVLRYGRLQSPILWDVLSVTTYLTGSALYLYLPMIPDVAALRDHAGPIAAWRRWIYTKLAIGWKGTADQWRRLERSITVMSIVIIPVAVSVHTVVSWIFSMTLRAGWHSTIFGPYFVVGAIFSGIAALLTAMGVFVVAFPSLRNYVTLDHFRKLASLLLAVTLLYIYFTISEYLTMGYSSESPDARLLTALFRGEFAWMFWTMAIIGLAIPALLLALPWTRTFGGIITASLLINLGMWLKRYVIVVPTLATPFMPPASGTMPHYVPTWVEWSITAGAFAGFGLLYLLFAKLFPIVSVWEVMEDQGEAPVAVSAAHHQAAVAAPSGTGVAL